MDEETALSALQARLGALGISGGEDLEGSKPPKVLDELTLEGVVNHIKKLKSSDNSE